MSFPFDFRRFGFAQDLAVKIRQLFNLGDAWTLVFGFPPDVWPDLTRARAMAEFNGLLYVGVEHLYGLQVWRSVDGVDWQQCVGPKASTPAGFGTASRSRATQMATLDGVLYVTTDIGVWTTTDGLTWTQAVGDGIESVDAWAVASFSGSVYVTSGTSLWRGKGSSGWIRVVGGQGMAKAGFGDPDITDITSLTVFDGALYAGAGKDNPTGNNGICVWRTYDGMSWQEFQTAKGSLHVHTMASFGGHLYVGGYHVLHVYRTDGTKGTTQSWVDVTDGISTGASNDAAWSMGTYDGRLYLGVTGVHSGKILWWTGDGTTWSLVDTTTVGTDKSHADALTEYKGDLYLTTSRTYPGPSYQERKVEVWRFGPTWGWPMKYFKPILWRRTIIRIPPGPWGPTGPASPTGQPLTDIGPT
ncbi:MAG: hypothetical protein IPM45_02510 [Acidimicrobiales bacterium]|nr:hypothetical protein [Acidimicrobiales bacterium]